MKVPFVKMEAQGNDFLILESDKVEIETEVLPDLAIEICDRHFGLGADGLVKLNINLPEMRIFNSDGSEAEMCGSALRCCCALLAKITGKRVISIKTGNGGLQGLIDEVDNNYVTVEIGQPILKRQGLELEGQTGDYISIGNPHFVIFLKDFTSDPHLVSGPGISANPFFTEGANVEFVRIINRDEIELKIWERGAGATLACGTGSVAGVFSGHIHGFLNDKVRVKVPGGEVFVHRQNSLYYLGGKTSFIASGEYEWRI
jgi:diaminopimelate epimerase